MRTPITLSLCRWVFFDVVTKISKETMFLNEVFSGTTFLKHWGKGPLRVLANQRLGPRRWCYQRSKVKTRTSMECQAASNTGRLQDRISQVQEVESDTPFQRKGIRTQSPR